MCGYNRALDTVGLSLSHYVNVTTVPLNISILLARIPEPVSKITAYTDDNRLGYTDMTQSPLRGGHT
jgi:hypothetical protein